MEMEDGGMIKKKKIFAIVGSAGKNSSNLHLVRWLSNKYSNQYELTIFDSLGELPHFNPELSIDNTPRQILDLRELITKADGVLICTPEYIFSIPSGLKNLLEWCVSTTIFSKKPVGLITASANGTKGHEELKMIMRTIEAVFTDDSTLLIHGIKGKIGEHGNMKDQKMELDLMNFMTAFTNLIEHPLS